MEIRLYHQHFSLEYHQPSLFGVVIIYMSIISLPFQIIQAKVPTIEIILVAAEMLIQICDFCSSLIIFCRSEDTQKIQIQLFSSLLSKMFFSQNKSLVAIKIHIYNHFMVFGRQIQMHLLAIMYKVRNTGIVRVILLILDFSRIGIISPFFLKL